MYTHGWSLSLDSGSEPLDATGGFMPPWVLAVRDATSTPYLPWAVPGPSVVRKGRGANCFTCEAPAIENGKCSILT